MLLSKISGSTGTIFFTAFHKFCSSIIFKFSTTWTLDYPDYFVPTSLNNRALTVLNQGLLICSARGRVRKVLKQF